jgi:prepilin-type N-terminal cleavage/methylation domain-containing protein
MSTAISDPRRRWARRGFTLIEVIGAVAAFTIAFLAGSAAFARLLQQQTTTYHRTLAASAAMLLTDWHVDKNSPGTDGFLVSTTDILDAPGTDTLFDNRNLQFSNEDGSSTAADADVVRVFKPSVSGFDDRALATFRSLVITVSPPSATEADSTMTWRQVTFWQGHAENVLLKKPTTLHFLARFLIPDQHP